MWGIRGGLVGPLVVPATYNVKLTVEGREFDQKLIVEKDPNTAGSKADIQAQVDMVLEIQDNINTVVDSINQIEWIRKQIHDLMELLKGKDHISTVITAAGKLDKKIEAVEGNFFQKILAEGDLKSFRAPVMLYSQLALLAGDVAGMSADFPPTAQQLEVHEELKKELAVALDKLNDLIEKDITAFNMLLKEKNIPSIISRTP